MEPHFFGVFDIFVGLAWALIIVAIGYFIRAKNKAKPHYKYFMPALFFKLIFASIFALTYVFVLEGGDTTAYWEGAAKLNHLFWESPIAYFSELWQTPSSTTITLHFNNLTGYPPIWIYKEPESWFICKLVSPLTFLTFNSYYGLTIICSGFIFISSWKLFEFVKDFTFCRHWILVFATLFIPTVAFWSSGLSKDTVVLTAMQTCVVILFSYLFRKGRFSIKKLCVLLFFLLILKSTRDFMLVVIFVPFFVVLLLRLVKNFTADKMFRGILKTFIFLIATTVTVGYLSFNSEILLENTFLEEASIKQQDFAQNKNYKGPRYDLGITDYSSVGMLKASPKAIIASFYRPFLWEASSPFLLLSALEGLFLLYLTFSFLFRSGNILSQFNYVANNEFLLFSLIFTIIFGFFVGFTAGLLNVLVRFKAPLMALLVILLASKRPNRIKAKK